MKRPDEEEGPLAEEQDFDIREAYPLMDAVARTEGWDDAEMGSYDVYSRDLLS